MERQNKHFLDPVQNQFWQFEKNPQFFITCKTEREGVGFC